MQITDVRVKLAENQQERLLAFCTLTIDHGFVIRDVKVIEGLKGPFVAMPSRKVMARCHGCGDKNHLKARYCNNCGASLEPASAMDDGRGRPRLYVDIAHPINQRCRATIETACIQAFQAELFAKRAIVRGLAQGFKQLEYVLATGDRVFVFTGFATGIRVLSD